MNVTIVTPIRDAIKHLPAYELMVSGISSKHRLDIILVEGDSVDGTYEVAKAMAKRSDKFAGVLKCDTGTPKYGSVVNPDRFKALATVFNFGLDAVDRGWSDYVLLLPVDMTWRCGPLVDKLVAHDVDVVSPFVFMDSVFYDIWAFSFKDVFFPPFRINAPQHWLTVHSNGLVPLTTAGGTMLFRSSVIEAGVRYSEVDVDRGFTRHARSLGFGVWGDPNTQVFHSK